ncbi:hypothetical protein D7X12_13245 [Corallococcus sicarius]|uniref:Uncharacterized protein n=1 Tax=Corallococcus sicarius TaxID=2316726 RepID=A0A3A8NQR8_9BACT|nr:hypothetical protein D7X12_13245 [Corallococcus sicarius]
MEARSHHVEITGAVVARAGISLGRPSSLEVDPREVRGIRFPENVLAFDGDDAAPFEAKSNIRSSLGIIPLAVRHAGNQPKPANKVLFRDPTTYRHLQAPGIRDEIKDLPFLHLKLTGKSMDPIRRRNDVGICNPQ